MTIKKLKYELRFLTPAFLGNAGQSAQWRTPPIKALLRQWWRVVWAAENGFSNDIAAMRREEGLLFGHAWLEDDSFERDGRRVTTAARKSLVRLRLERWENGKLTSWNGLEQGTIHHPETEKTGYKVGPHAYLGYGPLDGRDGTCFSENTNAAIQAEKSAAISLAVPDADAPTLEKALALMHRYGTLGGRSRNGWGSLVLTPQTGTDSLPAYLPLRPWRDCLDRDWPHAIGCDGAEGNVPLIWQTAPHADWKALMKTLAVVKIGLRTQFVFTTGKNSPNPEDRHWLSYPVTNHSVQPWGGKARLPNSLRFKVRPDAQDPKKLRGVIFHVPCLPPPAFDPDKTAIEGVWQRVHAFLDAPPQKLTRSPA